jgi:hypothetical protein
MTLATDFTRLFTEGWASYLAGQITGLTWHASAPYAASDVGIWLVSFPTAAAFDTSVAVCLTPYPLTDDPTYADSEVGLQVKVRGVPNSDPRAAVWPWIDKIRNAVLGNWPLDLPGGVHVSTIMSGPSGSLGYDAKDRLTWAASFPCQVLRPGAHRL